MEQLRKEILLATNNEHKLKEYRQMLAPLGYIIECPKDLNVDSNPEEDGTTFKENAYIKAKAFIERVNRPVIADDSGLEVESLNGFPGIFSSRFAEKFSSYKEAQQALIKLAKESGSLKARFVCTICYLENINARPLFFEGECRGTLLEKPLGNNGFGYDPIFQCENGLCFGLASEEEKNKVSHRYNAIVKLATFLKIS